MGLKSFFQKIGEEFKTLFSKEPSFAQHVQSVVPYAAAVLQTVITFADPAIAPFVGTVIEKVEASLATVTALVQDGTPTAGSPASATVKTALASVNTNLSSLLALAEVKNSANAAKITAAVTEVTTEIDALLTVA